MIVVGGGPSAPEFYPWILASGMPVIACSTMLLPLQRAGIKVDVCCIIDPGSIMQLHFRGAVTDGELVYHRGVLDRIPREWTGPTRPRDDVPGPSVLHLAVDEAVRSGAKEVHLVGADFCYRDNQSHAPGVVTAYEPHDFIMVDGYKTERDLVDYRNELRCYIADHPYVTFIRHGDGLPL